MKQTAWLPVVALLLAGCSSLAVRVEPKVDLSRVHHIFIEVSATDNNGVYRMMLEDLRRRGFTVYSGPLTMMPRPTEVYIEYKDYWTWDIKNYLVQVDLKVRDARTQNLLASAQYFKPTGFASKPEEIVKRALDALFKKSGRSGRSR